MGKPFISFCTVAMNRINHIQQTLPVNLKENKSASVQFILLDCNSRDGLDEYIKRNFGRELNNGSLVYYKDKSATAFHRSHSRNMVMQLATGDIVCNLDADNYAGQGFGKYVQDMFSTQPDVCLTGVQNSWKPDAYGKLCVSKSNFLKVSGYDENFDGYGFEDYDLVNRLQLSGCETFTINKPEFLNAISHTQSERISNQQIFKDILSIFVHYVDSDTSILLYLLNDGKYASTTVINNYTTGSKVSGRVKAELPLSQFRIENGWKQGEWKIDSGRLHLSVNNHIEICDQVFKQEQASFRSSEHEYYEVSDQEMKTEALFFYSETINREMMLNNISNKKIRVNRIFGKGIVYRNFQDDPIQISN